MTSEETIIVVGAGICGLALARELSQAGRRVLVLEGRDRIGGRIYPLSTGDFGYPAEGGAEFIHGRAPLTRRLIREAGITPIPVQGSAWTFEDGVLSEDTDRIPHYDLFAVKLKALDCDVPISAFLSRDFPGPKFAPLRRSVSELVQGFDAANPDRASTLAFREEMGQLSAGPSQMRIKEGYGALVQYLADRCRAAGADIRLDHRVRSIHHGTRSRLECTNGEAVEFGTVVVTVPMPLIPRLEFVPAISQKVEAAKQVGFGGVIKSVIRFRDCWWAGARGKDLSDLSFLFSRERFPTWWTQFPSGLPVLTGWLAGPKAERLRDVSAEEISEMALASLSSILGVEMQVLKRECVSAAALNWSADAFAGGAYSYATVDDASARDELRCPVSDRIFFAGEALAEGSDASTVEGAIASGLRVARQVLSS